MRTVVLALIAAGLLATDAAGACVNQTARERAEVAQAIFTGVVEAGPVTPARIRVERWEKGSGPEVVEVDTGIHEDYALGEGISPQPGERWRIYGEFYEGRLMTGVCDGSHRIEGTPVAPWLRVGGRKAQLVPTTFAGRALAAALPQIRVARGKASQMRLPATVVDVRLIGGPARARASRRAGRWTIKIPRTARSGGRIVVDTGDGFFAARVLVRPSS